MAGQKTRRHERLGLLDADARRKGHVSVRTILERATRVLKALLQSLFRRSGEPATAAAEMVRETEGALHEAKTRAAQAAADLKRLQKSRDQLAQQADEWAQRAKEALADGREPEAREAVRHEIELRRSLSGLDEQIELLEPHGRDLRSQVLSLQTRLDEAKMRFRRLRVREGAVDSEASARRLQAEIDQDGRPGRLSQLDQEMDRWEAEVEARQALETDPAEQAIRELEREAPEVEERLAELRESIADHEGGVQTADES
jgi:phage shock protein A